MATFFATVKHDERFSSITSNKTTPEQMRFGKIRKPKLAASFTTNNPDDVVAATRRIEKPIAQKIEDGLERLLRDIEALQDAERWDGME